LRILRSSEFPQRIWHIFRGSKFREIPAFDFPIRCLFLEFGHFRAFVRPEFLAHFLSRDFPRRGPPRPPGGAKRPRRPPGGVGVSPPDGAGSRGQGKFLAGQMSIPAARLFQWADFLPILGFCPNF
jgi:hypothetical protein